MQNNLAVVFLMLRKMKVDVAEATKCARLDAISGFAFDRYEFISDRLSNSQYCHLKVWQYVTTSTFVE